MGSLLKLLAGVLRPWSGSVALDGRDPLRMDGRERARRVAWVPQAGGEAVPFRVAEFVMMGRYAYQTPWKRASPADREAVSRALERTDCAGLRERTLNTLSGGERRRVLIAAALAQEAPVLLNGQGGLTVMFTSHDLNAALQQSDHVLGLKAGRAAFHDVPGQVVGNGRLQELFDQPFRRIADGEGKRPYVVPQGRPA